MKAIQSVGIFTLLISFIMIMTNPSKDDYANSICENSNIPGCRTVLKASVERNNLVFFSIYQSRINSDEGSSLGIFRFFVSLP